MTESRPSGEDVDAARRENALIGYQMAINIFWYQGEQVWARFNVMLFANSVVLGSIGLVFTSQHELDVLTLLLSITGLLLCAIWFMQMQREAEYSTYYILAARELEEKYLSDPVKTLSRGGLFAEGKPITLEIGGEPKPLRMSRLAGTLRSRTAATLVIVILAGLYIAITLYNIMVLLGLF